LETLFTGCGNDLDMAVVYARRKAMTSATRSRQHPHPLHYSACLVRLWQDGAGQPWRASAQSVQSGALMRFADLEALFAFLKAQTEDNQGTNGDEGRSGK